MIRDKGVAYYGVFSPNKAIADYRDMSEHGINSILFAISEFDYHFWYRGLVKVIEKAKEMGFRVYITLWGWGGVFKGEPPSVYLHKNVEGRQLSALEGKSLDAACPNNEEFKEYVIASVERLSEEISADYLLLQEPAYKILKHENWSCRCEQCKSLFKDKYGYEMPKKLSQEVIEFREMSLIRFIREVAQAIKRIDKDKKVALCLPPKLETRLGIKNWESVLEVKELDMLGISLYQEYISFREKAEDVQNLIKFLKLKFLDNKKESLALVQGFNIPKGSEEGVVKLIRFLSSIEFTSVIIWSYRAGEGSLLESGDPEKLWGLIGKVYKES